MLHNSLNFIEEVKKLAERFGLSVSEVSVGENPAVTIKLRIEKARVEVTTITKHCTVRDEEGRSKSFEKSLSGWDQQSLEYIENIKGVRAVG